MNNCIIYKSGGCTKIRIFKDGVHKMVISTNPALLDEDMSIGSDCYEIPVVKQNVLICPCGGWFIVNTNKSTFSVSDARASIEPESIIFDGVI